MAKADKGHEKFAKGTKVTYTSPNGLKVEDCEVVRYISDRDIVRVKHIPTGNSYSGNSAQFE